MYIVIEIQTSGDTVATIVNKYNDRAEAEARYHGILAAAAVSAVPVHAAVMLTSAGTLVKNDYYRHVEEDA